MVSLPKLSSSSQYIVAFVILGILLLYIFILAKQTFFDTAQAETATTSSSQIKIATPSGRLEMNDLLQKTQKKILIFMGFLQKDKSDTSRKMNEQFNKYIY